MGPTRTQVDRARHKSIAKVLNPPSPLPQVDGVVESTSTPSYTYTYTHLHATSPYTNTCISTKAPPEPLVGPEWPPPPGPWACDPATADPATTCTLCGANPWDLIHDIQGWGGLCPNCAYTMLYPVG